MTKERNDAGAAAGSAISAVSALMDERRRYESWIEALDKKRESTPDHVFTRVQADYHSRLNAVVEKLASHADDLRKEITALTSRLSSIREDHQRATDERAEAELRAHVGELSSEDWDRMASASDKTLSELSGQASDVEKELGRTRELLADAERPTPAPAAARIPEPVAAAKPVEEPPRVATSDAAEAGAHVPAAPRAPEVPPAPVSQPPVAAPPAPRPSAPVAQQASGNGFDELSFLRSVVDTPAVPATEPPPHDEPDEASKLDSFKRRSREEAVHNTGDQPLIMRSSGEELSHPSPLVYQRTPGSALDPVKDPAIEGAKTLRCGECGALNYPTEWYCERCGAELASL
jgi:hypothetical protein